MSQFTNRMDSETFQVFWAALQRGEFISGAAEQVGAYRKQGSRWVAACGGVRPRRGRDLKGRCLTFAQREEIALGIAGGETIRAIVGLGRPLADVDHVAPQHAVLARTGVPAGLTQRAAGTQAGRQLATQRAPRLHVQRLVDRFGRHPHLRVIRKPAAQTAGDLLRREALEQIVLHALAQHDVDGQLRWLGSARAGV